MSLSWKQLAVSVGFLIIGGGLGSWVTQYTVKKQQITHQFEMLPTKVQSIATQSSSLPQENINFIARAVQKVGDSVVRIDASRQVKSNNERSFFDRFFDKDSSQLEEKVERGTGSGFIINANGGLITNAHVVEGANTVKVTLKNGRIFQGKVLGVDDVTDVAVVKINALNLPTVSIASEENLIPGEWAIAIGNPLGLDNTVTVGIISALNRSSSDVGIPDKRVKFIQTDAAINPGNSGGPLLNAQGEVIGINTAIRADAQGLGFAIPIDTARKVAQQIWTTGKVEHPYLGINMLTLNEENRQEIQNSEYFDFQLPAEKGVLIVRIFENSPAQKAGFQIGDLIQKVGGVSVETALGVQEKVEESEIGSELIVEVKRQGKTQTITVIPQAFPKNESD
jgi:S1-C subfamily serine protease